MRTRLLSLLGWALLNASWPGLLHAHEDTLIKQQGTSLVGLPQEYAPAEFDVKAFRLRIGKHVMTFAPLLQSLFDEPHSLRISASWYHSRSILPPYLLLEIRPNKKDFISYGILLNLETLELIQLSVSVRDSEAGSS